MMKSWHYHNDLDNTTLTSHNILIFWQYNIMTSWCWHLDIDIMHDTAWHAIIKPWSEVKGIDSMPLTSLHWLDEIDIMTSWHWHHDVEAMTLNKDLTNWLLTIATIASIDTTWSCFIYIYNGKIMLHHWESDQFRTRVWLDHDQKGSLWNDCFNVSEISVGVAIKPPPRPSFHHVDRLSHSTSGQLWPPQLSLTRACGYVKALCRVELKLRT